MLNVIFPQPGDNLFYKRIRVALMLGNLGSVARHLSFSELLADNAVQQSIAQHFNQTIAPVADLLVQNKILLRQIGLVLGDRVGQFGGTGALAGYGLYDGGRPVAMALGEGLHGADLTLNPLRPFAVALVDDKN